MLLQIWLQFCNNSGFIAISDIMLFFPLLDDWILCRIGMVGEKCGLTVIVLINAQSIMHIVFQLYVVLRFGFTVVINVLINISSSKLNNQIFLIWKLEVHECTSGLTSTPKAELFCSYKRWKFIGQNKVKICKLESQNLKFLGQKIGCPNDDVFVLDATANVCTMVHLVCLFMNPHLLALLQDICLDLVHCALLRKVSECVRNITAFCQHLLKPIKLAILADTDISAKPKYRPGISARPYIGLFLNTA